MLYTLLLSSRHISTFYREQLFTTDHSMKRYIQSWKHNRRFGLPFRLVPSSWNCPLTPLAHFSWLWLVRKQYIWLEGLPSLEELFLLMTQQKRGLQLYFSNCLVKAFKWLTMNCRTQFRHLGMLDIDTFTKVSERLEFLLYSECICRLLLFSDGSCTFCNRNWLPTHLYGTYPLWSCGQRACQMLTHPSCLFTLWDICDGLLLGNSHEGRISILLRSDPATTVAQLLLGLAQHQPLRSAVSLGDSAERNSDGSPTP